MVIPVAGKFVIWEGCCDIDRLFVLELAGLVVE